MKLKNTGKYEMLNANQREAADSALKILSKSPNPKTGRIIVTVKEQNKYVKYGVMFLVVSETQNEAEIMAVDRINS